MINNEARVWGIPCPRTDDDDVPAPRIYWWWFQLYRLTRMSQHLIGWHVNHRGRCDWCGRATQVGGGE
jgi:hypothetical protein